MARIYQRRAEIFLNMKNITVIPTVINSITIIRYKALTHTVTVKMFIIIASIRDLYDCTVAVMFNITAFLSVKAKATAR
jgi:hypothetical protein